MKNRRENMKDSMKNTIQIVVLLVLVVGFAVFFGLTKGNDKLNLNFDINISQKEEFSYPIVSSSYNGEYRSNKGNGVFAMVGKNEDGTFRVYFIYQVASTKNVILKLDSVEMKDGKIAFKNADNVDLTMEFGEKSFRIPKEIGYGDAKLEGDYVKMKDISTFSMSEFEYFNY